MFHALSQIIEQKEMEERYKKEKRKVIFLALVKSRRGLLGNLNIPNAPCIIMHDALVQDCLFDRTSSMNFSKVGCYVSLLIAKSRNQCLSGGA